METLILGAGLAGISTAYFLQQQREGRITLLEKEEKPGGLCRSIRKNGYVYDIGPHILFSKDKEMLNLMLSVLEKKNDLRRSNQIIHKGRWVQYPFENDLSKLPKEDLEYCINAFENNPYENYEAANMLQFFLKTFGEGIANCYLRPYNEKIWKYDPAFMNTSMVDRIPKPTKEEIRRSAAGETVEGYVHQLYFSYPADGGIEAVPNGFLKKLEPSRCRVLTGRRVTEIEKKDDGFAVGTEKGERYFAKRLISTIPVQELTAAYKAASDEVKRHAAGLRYNSIAVAFVKVPYDKCGDNFAFMIADKNIIFHRISKMDFLGQAYHRGTEATYMAEVTYRKGDNISCMSEEALAEKIKEGLAAIGFAQKKQDAKIVDISRYEYAYVIYDLAHGENMRAIRRFYEREKIFLNGRFGNFEYWNMDRILRESLTLTQRLTSLRGSEL